MDSTQSWTDPAPLLSALAVGAGRRLLWLGGAADHALAAAIAGADVTIAGGEDVRALAELKREAARELDLGAYRELLGLGPPGRRIFYYHHVRKRLSPEEWEMMDEFRQLPADVQKVARVRIVELLEEFGPRSKKNPFGQGNN